MCNCVLYQITKDSSVTDTTVAQVKFEAAPQVASDPYEHDREKQENIQIKDVAQVNIKPQWDVTVDLALGEPFILSNKYQGGSETDEKLFCWSLSQRRADNAHVELEITRHALLQLSEIVYLNQTSDKLIDFLSSRRAAEILFLALCLSKAHVPFHTVCRW